MVFVVIPLKTFRMVLKNEYICIIRINLNKYEMG